MKLKGFNIRKVDRAGMSLIHHAAKTDNPDVIRTIVENMPDNLEMLVLRDSTGKTPIHYVMDKPNAAASIEALFHGMSSFDKSFYLPRMEFNGMNPFHIAAKRGDAAAISALFQGTEPMVMKALETTNRDGQTPFHLAARAQTPDALEALTKKVGTSLERHLMALDDAGETPLHFAVKAGKLGNVKTIVSHLDGFQKFKLSAMDSYAGYTAHHFAAARGDKEVLDLLMTGLTKEQKETILETQDKSGRTPLHISAYKNDGSYTTALLEQTNGLADRHLADILNSKDQKGNTPMDATTDPKIKAALNERLSKVTAALANVDFMPKKYKAHRDYLDAKLSGVIHDNKRSPRSWAEDAKGFASSSDVASMAKEKYGVTNQEQIDIVTYIRSNIATPTMINGLKKLPKYKGLAIRNTYLNPSSLPNPGTTLTASQLTNGKNVLAASTESIYGSVQEKQYLLLIETRQACDMRPFNRLEDEVLILGDNKLTILGVDHKKKLVYLSDSNLLAEA